MRRKDRQLTESEARAILEWGEYGVLSMCTPEGGGYGVPLNYALWNDQLYFHCAIEGSKLECLRNNGSVSFCVVGATEVMPEKFGTKYESVIAYGTAAEVSGDEKRSALRRLIEKYSPDYLSEGEDYIDAYFERTGVIRMSIEHLSGKARKS